MKISVSLLASYLYCPRKIYLERVLKLFEPPKEALVKGTIKHKMFETMNEIEEKIVLCVKNHEILANLEEIYKKAYSKILKNIIIKNKARLDQFNIDPRIFFEQTIPIFNQQAEERSLNIINFVDKHSIFGQELWEKLTPKIHCEFRIKSDELGLSGIIDQLEVYENDYVPIELKSGTAPKEDVWPNHKIQLAAYAMLLEERYNKEIKEGFIHYIDSNERRHVPINIFIKDEVNELKEKVKQLLNSLEIPEFCGNENKCSSCGLKEKCYDERYLNKLQAEVKKAK